MSVCSSLIICLFSNGVVPLNSVLEQIAVLFSWEVSGRKTVWCKILCDWVVQVGGFVAVWEGHFKALHMSSCHPINEPPMRWYATICKWCTSLHLCCMFLFSSSLRQSSTHGELIYHRQTSTGEVRKSTLLIMHDVEYTDNVKDTSNGYESFFLRFSRKI